MVKLALYLRTSTKEKLKNIPLPPKKQIQKSIMIPILTFQAWKIA